MPCRREGIFSISVLYLLFRCIIHIFTRVHIFMSRKKKSLPIIENVTIESVAAEGKSIVRWNDMVVFVPFCIPGDVVDLQVRKKKHSYCEAEVIRFHKYSDMRIEPRCSHFGLCGGCKWQQLPYEEQLKAKQEQVMQQLRRIGHIELPECTPILGSQKQFEYRNKIEFGCSNKRWLTKEEISEGAEYEDMNAIGFHITGAFDKILPIERCHLMDNLCNNIRNGIAQYAREHRITHYNPREQHGLLRDMMIRNSNTGEWMVLIQFGPQKHVDPSEAYDEAEKMALFDREGAMALMEYISTNFPQITSLLWVYNPKCNDTFGDMRVNVYKGNDHIFEIMEELRFKVGPKSFYQTNTDQAYHLYCVARDFAQLTGNEIVYDLYTGTGTIANFVARKARKVIGIEYVPEAIEDAKVNSCINGIGNTQFFAGDMKDILTEDFIRQHGRPDTIITDPPRAGMHQDVINVILFAQPNRIVYVSCNPATQARDLQLLDKEYRVVRIQPVDMFPHTPHVENVVLLERR